MHRYRYIARLANKRAHVLQRNQYDLKLDLYHGSTRIILYMSTGRQSRSQMEYGELDDTYIGK
jgi:hypothetical protein